MKLFKATFARVLSAILLMAMVPTAFGQMQDFIGKWVNVDKETRSITRLEINAGTLEDTLKVRAFGSCSPTDCDWGVTDLILYGASISDTNFQYGTAMYDSGFSKNILTMELKDDGRLMLNSFDKFVDDDTRNNYHGYDIFRKTD